jgi:hypothetical protein
MLNTKDDARYGTGVPRNISEGRVLAHNHVQHGVETSAGVNGFRWWTWSKSAVPKHFVRCKCGYSGLPHVAMKEHANSYKCEKVSTKISVRNGMFRIWEVHT